ncbi:hypothetical protein Dtox_3347 [Desulfofarcimen acetoxidans DSM 771]|jgi:hypothetical protein|uniref:Uncharacterized protein n=1 Tax=Desulfofarcimen acetoxidans (strain ATCC 49208 / DSM 771 / KCTC 5769 / VKM B-1644 / 5575) TaxID=485916 RepID=C8W5S7_DESAS|nr:hypothetical protein [Desulfofarcimen acetoxidans]ACV64077.1 hypothetical protein Dtox_3347 [Desulfofarcimen acetoxidans DSM 771]
MNKCVVSWPCSRSEILEVVYNIGCGRCEVKKRSSISKLWSAIISLIS